MSYIVSARKYRPKTFDEVVGQEHITSTLKNALLHDKLAHAFLFCGPRGVGKTTCARLLAKVINMPDPKKAVQDGSYADMNIDISLNIIELDAASNNSVEHIRTLIDQVRFQPQQGKYKVFIIDEVHMLSQAAFNAFLKTLEEPPPYALFILATTEKHKILPTILSRCQLYDFRRIQILDIIQQLSHIAESEGIQYEEDALYIIAEKADGALRDALSIFDRLASATGQNITYQDVISNLNILDYDYYFKALDYILSEDGPGILLLLQEILNNGFEGDTFMVGLAGHIRFLMYCKQEKTLSILQAGDQLKNRYLQQSRSIPYSLILNLLHLANECDIHYPKVKDKKLHIEIALLKMCYAARMKKASIALDVPEEEKKTEDKNRLASGGKVEAVPIPDPGNIEEDVVMDVIESSEEEPIKSIEKLRNTPSLPSLEEVLTEAKVVVDSQNGSKKELVLDEAQQIWKTYEDDSSSPTTKAIIGQAILAVEGQRLKVYVPSNIAKEEIQQETELYTQLRDHFNQQDLMIEIVVDRNLFPDSDQDLPKKLYTAKEKYDHLVSQNPMLEDLIDKLNLKLDQD